jgi:hypothetical protein
MKVIAINGFSCGELRQLSDAYIDNELLIETNLQILRHTGDCNACQTYIDQKLELRDRVRVVVKGQAAPGKLVRNLKAFLRSHGAA